MPPNAHGSFQPQATNALRTNCTIVHFSKHFHNLSQNALFLHSVFLPLVTIHILITSHRDLVLTQFSHILLMAICISQIFEDDNHRQLHLIQYGNYCSISYNQLHDNNCDLIILHDTNRKYSISKFKKYHLCLNFWFFAFICGSCISVQYPKTFSCP